VAPPPDNNPIRLTVVTDPDGKPQIVDYAAGPEALLDQALQVMSQWVLEPMKVNGAPVVMPLTIPVRALAPPTGLTPGAVSGSGGVPGLNSLSTLNLTRTQDMATMPPAQCAVASDAGFGRSPAQPIPVGGGVEQVIERARLFLIGMRGDKGQGLTVRRTGSGPAPPAGTLEVFEVTRNGDAAPTSLYFDATRWADIVAPQGFVCVGPMLLKPPR
jgi:hypothetical protein